MMELKMEQLSIKRLLKICCLNLSTQMIDIAVEMLSQQDEQQGIKVKWWMVCRKKPENDGKREENCSNVMYLSFSLKVHFATKS